MSPQPHPLAATGARVDQPSVDTPLVELRYGRRITPTGRGGVLHRAAAAHPQPAPLRGVARVLRRRPDPRPSRATLRLHPLDDGRPGARLPGRAPGVVRPAPQTRPTA